MDKEAAVTMMEGIPPFDWTEVALKKDIEKSFALAKAETAAAIAESTQAQTKTFVGWMLTGMTILIAASTAITHFAK